MSSTNAAAKCLADRVSVYNESVTFLTLFDTHRRAWSGACENLKAETAGETIGPPGKFIDVRWITAVFLWADY